MGITNAGKVEVAKLIVGYDSPVKFTYLELGTGSTAFAATQTALATAITGSGLARAAATASVTTTTVTNDTSQLVYEWTASGTVTVREIGAFNHVTTGSGDMLARKVLDVAKALVSGDTYEYTMTIAVA